MKFLYVYTVWYENKSGRRIGEKLTFIMPENDAEAFAKAKKMLKAVTNLGPYDKPFTIQMDKARE